MVLLRLVSHSKAPSATQLAMIRTAVLPFRTPLLLVLCLHMMALPFAWMMFSLSEE